MNKRFAAIAIVVAAGAAAAGLFANPSNSAEQPWNCGPSYCSVWLTGSGPSPSTFNMLAGGRMVFYNADSVTHTVAFANGLCTLPLPPGWVGGPGYIVSGCGGHQLTDFTACAGNYAYTVDGNFTGTVVTTPWRRSVTLKARTHTLRRGTRLTLHGQVDLEGGGLGTRGPVIVLARHDSNHPFERIATAHLSWGRIYLDRWNLTVHPSETTTYIAKVTRQPPQCHF